ncbi:MAG TPA: methyltransferase domain-containing protein [Thermoanaerobaculia bacterium]|nr:methyltransferase domain-containing protein [Thermoanaerobaculia bacterium]
MPAAHYTLGATDAELRRLVALASHEEDRVVDACRRAGIGEGAVVADLGCGPLGALGALSRVVGDSGTVIGVDASAHALDKARVLLGDAPNVRLVQADVCELSMENLDAAYTRLMLLHQPDPARVLARVHAMLRPGGVFIAHEPSDQLVHAPASEPHVPAMTRVWELVIGAARSRGARTDFGRRGRVYLEAAGFEVEQTRAYAVHYPPEIGYEIPRVALASLRPVIEQHALATQDEVAQLDAELRAMQTRDDVQWVSSPLMFEWIARRGIRSPRICNPAEGSSARRSG